MVGILTEVSGKSYWNTEHDLKSRLASNQSLYGLFFPTACHNEPIVGEQGSNLALLQTTDLQNSNVSSR